LPVLAKVAREDRESREVRAASLVALGLLGDGRQATPLLLDVARDRRRDALERASAVHALGKLGEREALDALVGLTADDSRYVRRAAIQALGRIARPSDTRALRLVAEAAETDGDLLVRAYAAIALGRTGAPRAAIVLSNMVDHPNASLRGFGAMGLALLGRRNDSEPLRNRIVDFLRPRLSRRGGSAETRGAIAVALGVLGDLPSRPWLLRLVERGGDPRLRGHAAMALALLRAGEARPLLREVLEESNDPWLLQEVALAVGLLGDQEAVTRLSTLVRRGPSEATQVNAALALGRIGNTAALRAIVEMVSSEDLSAPARGMAAVSLGMVLDDRTLPALFVVAEDFDYMLPLASFWELLSIL
jgi:HEAT repeat protein